MSGGVSASTLMAASVAMSAIGTGMSIYGQQQQAAAQSAAANYQAQVARNNAIIARQNADAATQAGETQAEQALMKSGMTVGAARAAAAANGLDPNSGSPLSLQSDTAKTGELNALTIRNNAAWQAYGDQVNATSQTAQAGLDQAQAGWDTQAGNTSSMSSLLSGGSQVSGKWAQWQWQTGAGQGGNSPLSVTPDGMYTF
jgi:hypothetical protein